MSELFEKNYSRSEAPERAHEQSVENWLNSKGDLDDFIFWGEPPAGPSLR